MGQLIILEVHIHLLYLEQDFNLNMFRGRASVAWLVFVKEELFIKR